MLALMACLCHQLVLVCGACDLFFFVLLKCAACACACCLCLLCLLALACACSSACGLLYLMALAASPCSNYVLGLVFAFAGIALWLRAA